jgi:tRNA A-37 threonylcarbamoyl transferase component Bud32
LRRPRFSSEVPQELPNIIERTSEVPQGLPNIIEGTSEVPQELPNIIKGTSEVPQALPNIIKGVPSQDLELAANTLMKLQDLELAANPLMNLQDLELAANPLMNLQDLELAANTLMNLQILILPQSENPIAINELQCQYLLEKFCDTLTRSCIQDTSLQHIQGSHHTLKSLARLAKEAEKLVHDCCDAQWIQAAMIFGNAKEHFASLTFKLRLYMELLQNIFKEGATKEFLTKLQDPKWIDDVKDEEFHFIDEKAKEDQQRLLSRLTEVGSSDSENLIRRLHISSNRATFLQDNATSVIDAWKVEFKSIHLMRRRQIGKGGFNATVYEVKWLGKHFAEKCFHGRENQVFREQVSLLAGLSHPNILPLFCYGTRDHSCSLIMELMDGDLFQLMERLVNNESQDAPFELLEAVDIMLQVAEGMNYLHQNRVVHRDLKSMNILVKYNEQYGHVYAKVAGFELSKVEELSCTYSNLTLDVGTTRWMAPELFGDSEDHNVGPSSSSESLNYPFKVDVYSFGMVCYEILTGHFPFFNYTNQTGLRKRIKDGLRPDMPEQCPYQLSNLVQACYHPDPKARPSFRDICVDLRHIMCSLMVDSTS